MVAAWGGGIGARGCRLPPVLLPCLIAAFVALGALVADAHPEPPVLLRARPAPLRAPAARCPDLICVEPCLVPHVGCGPPVIARVAVLAGLVEALLDLMRELAPGPLFVCPWLVKHLPLCATSHRRMSGVVILREEQ